MKKYETEAIVIGGGATGTGTARDLAMRGVSTVLIEKNDIASGTTGRNHGLLHSGARYAVNDLESARECIAENKILKKIASHCVEDTGGLFVTLPEDDPSYHSLLMEHCRYAGIKCRDISLKEALKIEPNLNPNALSVLHVPDGTIDPFRLASANMLDARERGALILTHSRVTGVIRSGSEVTGVTGETADGETFEVHGRLVVNASGVWGQQICRLAGIDLLMFPSKGSMLIIDYRINSVVVNRCRMPADGDIIVPGDTVSLVGTTSQKIEYDKIDECIVENSEIDTLLSEGEKLIPNLSLTRAMRAYCGVRPLIAISGEMDGREISRGIVLIDHEKRDGLGGFITIAGGKLMTYRLMAKMAADLACLKLKNRARCRTHKEPLPGSERRSLSRRSVKSFTGIPRSIVGSTFYRHGERVSGILNTSKKNYALICECEMVTLGEIEYAIKNLQVKDLVDLRRRTRIGMG
ncbi:MAG TPA: anaerobic glycerol-3-phosphate dehydrogenase subunit A, partial [Spirochaetes bacterium]|nr:anaerobic glycerol-3-phosphate dehydrogenase subunit A [Spirochaetota bacterium]